MTMDSGSTQPAPLAATLPAVDLQAGLRDPGNFLPELEALRGIAILLVFAFHAWGVSGFSVAEAPDPWVGFVVAGNTGVTLFFVLSGFLIGLPWLRHLQDPHYRQPDLSAYLKARALRILPLYILALLLAGLDTGDWRAVGRAASFQFIGMDAFPWGVVWWTLGTEVQFYLLLPLAMLLWLQGTVGRVLVSSLLICWGIWYLQFVLAGNPGNGPMNYWTTKSLAARLPAFGIGLAAAWVWLRARHWQPGQRSRALSCLLVTGLIIALGMVLAEVARMGDRRAELHWHIHHSYEALLWGAIMLAALLARPRGVTPILRSRPLEVAGKLSYSFYLWHLPVLFYLIYPVRAALGETAWQDSAWPLLLSAAALILAFALAWLSFQCVERPFLRRKRELPVTNTGGN